MRLHGEFDVAIELGEFSWQRVIDAVEAVRERVRRAAAALERAGIPYAVVGGNAVAAWVARVDRRAVRNTQDVDILIRRCDLDAVRKALEGAGFLFHTVLGVDCFLDDTDGGPRDAVHLVYAGERVAPSHPAPAADVSESIRAEDFAVVTLDALVRMKLNAFRRKDQVQLLDLISLGLVDETWLERLMPVHAARLQELLDDPDG